MGSLSISKAQAEIRQVLDTISSDLGVYPVQLNRAAGARVHCLSKRSIRDRFIEPLQIAAQNLYLNIVKASQLIIKPAKWLVERIIRILPYSPKLILQDTVKHLQAPSQKLNRKEYWGWKVTKDYLAVE